MSRFKEYQTPKAMVVLGFALSIAILFEIFLWIFGL